MWCTIDWDRFNEPRNAGHLMGHKSPSRFRESAEIVVIACRTFHLSKLGGICIHCSFTANILGTGRMKTVKGYSSSQPGWFPLTYYFPICLAKTCRVSVSTVVRLLCINFYATYGLYFRNKSNMFRNVLYLHRNEYLTGTEHCDGSTNQHVAIH